MTRLTFVLAPGQNHFFVELAEALCDELRRLGADAETVTGGFPPLEPDRAYALIPPHEYFVLEGHRTPPSREQLRRTVFITAEQPETVHFRQNVAVADRAGALFDINARAARAYRRLGVRANHLQLGYTPSWDHFAAAEPVDDLIFMGAWTPRRGRVITDIAPDLAQLRGRYVFSDNSQPNTVASPGFLTGAEKWEALSRAYLLLNIHQGDEPYFEWHRALQAIHCGAAVLTESSTDAEPLIAGRHYAAATTAGLGRAASELARNPARASALAAEAYESIRSELPLARAAGTLAEAAADVLAGAGRPVGGRGRVAATAARARLRMSRAAAAREPERPPEPEITGAVPGIPEGQQFVWLLGPQAELLPGASEELTDALEADAAASFAYGLVADPGRGILNPLPWVPGRRPAPPLLVRTDALRYASTGPGDDLDRVVARLVSDRDAKGVNTQRLVARRI